MRQIVLVLVLALAGTIFLINACDKHDDQLIDKQKVVNTTKERAVESEFTPFKIPFPEGVEFEIKGKSIHFTVPKPYYIVGIDANGNFYKSVGNGNGGGSASITCECTSGNGCDPIIQGRKVGCLMKNGCNQCTRSTTKMRDVSQELVDIVIMHPDNDLYITDFSDIEGKYLLPSAFLDYEEIANDLKRIQHTAKTINPDEVEKLTFVNIHGYIVPIMLQMAPNDISLTGDDISCSCDSQGSCPLESHWTGVKYCITDNCSKCTMSGFSTKSTGEKKHFNTDNGFIVFE